MSDKPETPSEASTPKTTAAINALCDKYPLNADGSDWFYRFRDLEDFARTIERELAQWREVAGRLASVTTHQSECRFFIGESCDCGLDAAISAYDALAKLSDGGKG